MRSSSPKEASGIQDSQEDREAKDATSQKPEERPEAIEEPKPAAKQDDELLKDSTQAVKDKNQPAPVVDIQSLERSSIQIFGQPLSLP